MKASTEKTATSTSTTATQTPQEPFFGKKGGEGFFESAPQGNAPFIQAKLTVNQPGDIYEQEADRVADQVVQRLAMPSPEPASPLLSTAGKSPAPIQTKCADCEQEEKLQRKEEEVPEEREEIQRKEESASPSSPGDEAGSDFSTRLQSSKGGGAPLPENTRTDMESALGTDLSSVRIHTGGEAAGMSKDIHAQAFTHGSDVYFNDGKFDAGSTDGKRLLAHELVHVGQQGGGVNNSGIQKKEGTTIKANDIKEQLNEDKIYELMAHKYAYDNILSDKYIEELAEFGFEPYNNRVLDGNYDFQAWLFKPVRNENEKEKIPVVAFRGSQEVKDWINDIGSSGSPGMMKTSENIKMLNQVLEILEVPRVDVTGHSLGGALAQIFAASYPEKVRRVITFQSPGITSDLATKIRKFNASNATPVTSTHYRAKDDVVDNAGNAFTPGNVYEIRGGSLMSKIAGGVGGFFGTGGSPWGAWGGVEIASAIDAHKRDNLIGDALADPAMEVETHEAEGIGSVRPAEMGREALALVLKYLNVGAK